jgi:hypothetical protein
MGDTSKKKSESRGKCKNKTRRSNIYPAACKMARLLK